MDDGYTIPACGLCAPSGRFCRSTGGQDCRGIAATIGLDRLRAAV